MLAAYSVMTYKINYARFFLLGGAILFLATGISESFGFFDDSIFGRWVYGLCSILMVIGIAGGLQKNWVGIPILVRLGGASYSIYLVHLIVIGIVYKLMQITSITTYLPIWIIYFILVISGIAGGVLLSKLVEYPLMKLVRRAILRK